MPSYMAFGNVWGKYGGIIFTSPNHINSIKTLNECTKSGAISDMQPLNLVVHFFRTDWGAEPVREWL